MHRCSSSSPHGSHMGPCNCGLFQTSTTNSFSMLFSSPHSFDQSSSDPYPITSPSSVDCTLSLGTPSTRQSNHKSPGSFMSNLCGWSAFQSKPTIPSSTSGSINGGGGGGVINTLNGDPLVPRRCANCDTTSTPLWRNGPKGPKSLCNACGIRYKKEERRSINPTSAAQAPTIIESQHLMPQSWTHHHHYNHHHQSSEFRFIDDEDNNVPFLSWRLNVQDRPSLVHDCT